MWPSPLSSTLATPTEEWLGRLPSQETFIGEGCSGDHLHLLVTFSFTPLVNCWFALKLSTDHPTSTGLDCPSILSLGIPVRHKSSYICVQEIQRGPSAWLLPLSLAPTCFNTCEPGVMLTFKSFRLAKAPPVGRYRSLPTMRLSTCYQCFISLSRSLLNPFLSFLGLP